MFKNLIDSINTNSISDSFKKDSFVYPVSESNLEAIKILIHNSFQQGQSESSNVEWVTINPTIWLADFLESYIQHIKFVSTGPSFSILRMTTDDLIYNTYHCDSIRLNSEDELSDFFMKNEWNSLVIYGIVKIADLRTMSAWYNIRYADVTEKYEKIDNKLNKILE